MMVNTIRIVQYSWPTKLPCMFDSSQLHLASLALTSVGKKKELGPHFGGFQGFYANNKQQQQQLSSGLISDRLL